MFKAMVKPLIPGYAKEPRCGVPLAPYTTWNIGGPADTFVEPATRDELLAVFRYALGARLPLTILGRGSNSLVDDAGVPGVVVCLRQVFDRVEVLGARQLVRAEAGCPLPKLAVAAGRHGLSGFEFLIGIPGTVGAGVAINAGTGGVDGPSIRDILVDAAVLDLQTGEVRVLSAEQLGLRYRHSDVLGRLWVLEASFRGDVSDDPQAIQERHKEALKKRALKQPLGRHTSGSVFKQPLGGQPAGWYIDHAGLKGYRVGNAVVSAKHANWIENVGGASSADVRALMAHVQRTVLEAFGVALEREVRFLPEDSLGGAHP